MVHCFVVADDAPKIHKIYFAFVKSQSVIRMNDSGMISSGQETSEGQTEAACCHVGHQFQLDCSYDGAYEQDRVEFLH